MELGLSYLTSQYIVFYLYFFLIISYGVVENIWVRRISNTNRPRALLFTLITNLLGWCIGFGLFFVFVGVTFALAWDGTMQNLPLQGNEVFVFLVLLIILVPGTLMLIKRVGLAFFTVTNRTAWKFSLLSSVLFWFVPLFITVLVGWLLFRPF